MKNILTAILLMSNIAISNVAISDVLVEQHDLILKKVIELDDSYLGGDVEKTPISGLYRVKNKEHEIFVNKSVDFFITGDMFKLLPSGNIKSIKVLEKEGEVKSYLSKLKKEHLMTYQSENPNGKEIYVFFDITCPICNKFHQYVPRLVKEGYNVHYLPFPRSGSKNIHLLNAFNKIMCSDNPTHQIDEAYKSPRNYLFSSTAPTQSCNHVPLIYQYYKLGRDLKIKGTPSIFLDNGQYLGGFVSWKVLSNRIEEALENY